jgi:CO/xanthine dehydrogenase Mo-binding subunit
VLRFVGDEVALGAESEVIAEDALRLIRSAGAPALFDAEEALQSGAPLVHPQGNLVVANLVVERGGGRDLQRRHGCSRTVFIPRCTLRWAWKPVLH